MRDRTIAIAQLDGDGQPVGEPVEFLPHSRAEHLTIAIDESGVHFERTVRLPAGVPDTSG